MGTTYKWHTFRITWDNDEGMIKVFEHSKSEPFLQISAKIRHGHWNPESHVWIGSDKPAQIRLHSCKYDDLPMLVASGAASISSSSLTFLSR